MRYKQRKSRLMTGIASLVFFVAASLCFGFALQGRADSSILGFHINEDARSLLDLLPFFNTQAESRDLYPIGDVQNQVILVNFPKSEASEIWLDDEKMQRANSLLNGSTDSLKQYIFEISKRTVNVNSSFYGYGNGNDGFVASKDLSYYIGEGENLEREVESQREYELLREIIEQMNDNDALADKSKAELDTNDDGYIDNMTFVIHGNKNNDYNLLWPHQFSFSSNKDNGYPEITCEAGNATLKVKDYMVIISGDSSSGIFGSSNRGLFTEYSDLGVIAHEYLHVYGFPDMYHNYKYENDKFVPLESGEQRGDPLGQWDIMDNTISDYPQNPLYYTNLTYSPWGDQLSEPINIQESTQKVVLHKLDYANDNGAMAAIIKVDSSVNALGDDEYFMVEYRKQEGWDERLPGSGLIVYRINTGANLKNAESAIVKYCSNIDEGKVNHCGNMFGPPDEVYIFRPGVESITDQKASSDFNLLNAAISENGEWTSLGRTLAEVSEYQPSSEFSNTIYFSDGSNSGIVISNVVEAQDTISFDVVVPEPKVDTAKPEIAETIEGNGIAGRWTKGSPTLSVYISDSGHGLATIEVTTSDGELVGGSDAQSYTKTYTAADHMKYTTFTFQVAKNGTYRIRAIDLAGNISDIRTVKVENIDQELPVVEIGEVTKTPLETRIPITFTDLQSGIEPGSAYYTTKGIKESVNQLSYPYPIEHNVILLDSDFQGKVCVTVKDQAGNGLKEPTCWILSDDKTAPSIEVSSDEAVHGYTRDHQTITISATEGQKDDTGISYFEVETQDGAIDAPNERHLIKDYGTDGTLTASYQFAVTANGTYVVKACDYAQNCTDGKITISNIDRSAPVITDIKIINKNEIGLFISGSHEISFVAHDEPINANSGLAEIRYQLVRDGETYEDDFSSLKWISIGINETIISEDDFVGTIYAYAIDQVGNPSKVYQKRIERISSDGMTAGIHDESHSVAILGIDDPDVSVHMETVDQAQVEALLGDDFLASHELQNVYNFTLLKNNARYELEDSVTVRLKVEKELLEDGSLRLIAIDEDGATANIDTALGEGYLEFETEEIKHLYATVTEKKGEQSQADFIVSGANTGDASSLLLYVALVLGGIAIATILVRTHRNEEQF